MVIPVARRFEFRLLETGDPAGTLDADNLLAVVHSLKILAARLGRAELGSARTGRPSHQLERVARLRIGMEPGSTRIVVERHDDNMLDFDLADEAAVDQQFEEIVTSISRDERPVWVNDSQADAAADLLSALKLSARFVEFSADGVQRASFTTSRANVDIWRRTQPTRPADDVTMIGRLEKVDLKSREFRIRDDVGNAIRLPQVDSADAAGHLIGSHVCVSGLAQRDNDGRVVGIHHAAIESAPQPISPAGTLGAAPFESAFLGGSAPEMEDDAGLTNAEADAFLEAMGL